MPAGNSGYPAFLLLQVDENRGFVSDGTGKQHGLKEIEAMLNITEEKAA